MKLECTDCGMDVRSEMFMVHDILWELVTLHDSARFLCIGCIEDRMGRALIVHDFAPLHTNVKTGGWRCSDRLRDRLANFNDLYREAAHHQMHIILDLNNARAAQYGSDVRFSCSVCEVYP